MTIAGVTYDTLKREVWRPELQNAIFDNFWFFDQSVFKKVSPQDGDTIATGYETSVSTNAGTYDYDDAMVEAYTSTQVKAYFTKDSFQETARAFNQLLRKRGEGGYEVKGLNARKRIIERAARNLKDRVMTTMLTDAESQVSSSSAYSDASLSRTTYATLRSYQEDTTTDLTLGHLEDAIEALETHTTYGLGVQSYQDLVILAPRNQITNLARLALGTAALTLTNQIPDGPIDAGRVFRTKVFEGIDVIPVADMTTTTIMILHKPDVTVYMGSDLTITPKDEPADTELNLLTMDCNVVIENPNNHAILTSKTA